jgi:hypothetical protein
MAKTDEEFAKSLMESRDAVFAVAKWLHKKDYDLFIPRIVLRPKYAKADDYVDDGDIHMTKAGVTHKVNVKGHPGLKFTDTYWPFKHVLVTSKRFVDLKGDDIGYYMSVSGDFKYVAVTNRAKTKHAWFLVTYYNKHSRQEETAYACPTDLVKFFKIEGDE